MSVENQQQEGRHHHFVRFMFRLMTRGTDARGVANCLLDLADRHDVGLSITSLLKIIYFSHGWHLAQFGSPLVGQPFEAWQHGPVVRVVYDEFKKESGSCLRGRARKLNLVTGELEICHWDFSEDRIKFLESILLSYSRYHPYSLSEMTHELGSPWQKIWVAAETESIPGMRIPNELIRDYFLSRNNSDLYRV